MAWILVCSCKAMRLKKVLRTKLQSNKIFLIGADLDIDNKQNLLTLFLT